MTDILYHHNEYSRSKHIRRIKSRHKKSQKLCAKKENIQKHHQIRYKPRRQIKGKKFTREIQRKQWSKYNKKSKSRDKRQEYIYEAIEDLYASDTDISDGDDDTDLRPTVDDDGYDEYDPGKEILVMDEVKISQSYSKHDYYNTAILKTAVQEIMAKSFQSYDSKYNPFDMATFDGQCHFWHYIMDKLGIIKELFYTQYLIKCDKEYESKLSYYTAVVDGIISNVLSTKHVLYILNEVDLMTDGYFNDMYHYDAKYVVMNKKVLIEILDENNSENIGYDLCHMIAGFVMTDHKDDVLCRYQQKDRIKEEEEDKADDDKKEEDEQQNRRKKKKKKDKKKEEVKTKRYKIEEHEIIDKVVEVQKEYSTDSEVIAKIYDAKDITTDYNKSKDLWSNSTPLFHYGKYRFTYSNILQIVWVKFKRYYEHQTMHQLKVNYSVLYMILLYYIENSMVCRNILCEFDAKAKDKKIWKKAMKETEGNLLLQSLLSMINKAVDICRVGKRQKFLNIFKDDLKETAVNGKCVDMEYFCTMMMRNCYFNDSFIVDDFFKNDDHHLQHKQFWIDIWKMLPSNMDSMKFKYVYNLTIAHCQKYQKYAEKHRQFGCARRGNRSVWGEQKMRKFDVVEFIYSDIIPIIINKLGLMVVYNDEVERRMINMLRYENKNELVSYDVMMESIYRMIKILEDEKCRYSALNMIDDEEYRMDKYSKKYLSKKIYFVKKDLKKRYRKYGGKSMDKRIKNKMRKYGNKYLLA